MNFIRIFVYLLCKTGIRKSCSGMISNTDSTMDRVESVQRYFTKHVVGIEILSYQGRLESLHLELYNIKLDLKPLKLNNRFVDINIHVCCFYRFREVFWDHNRTISAIMLRQIRESIFS